MKRSRLLLTLHRPASADLRRCGVHPGRCWSYRLALDLHEKGDLNKAAHAYLQAEAAGVDEAAFNLGVLLYDASDYEGAEEAWTRCLAHQHARAATYLGFLLAQRGDVAHARLTYSAAELWGDPEAAGRRTAVAAGCVSDKLSTVDQRLHGLRPKSAAIRVEPRPGCAARGRHKCGSRAPGRVAPT